MPNAEVTLVNADTGFSRTTKTDKDGSYQFVQIPPATYTLTTSTPGFATDRHAGLELLVNNPYTLNVSLQVASVATTVEVVGTIPAANTQAQLFQSYPD